MSLLVSFGVFVLYYPSEIHLLQEEDGVEGGPLDNEEPNAGQVEEGSGLLEGLKDICKGDISLPL